MPGTQLEVYSRRGFTEEAIEVGTPRRLLRRLLRYRQERLYRAKRSRYIAGQELAPLLVVYCIAEWRSQSRGGRRGVEERCDPNAVGKRGGVQQTAKRSLCSLNRV